MERIVLSHALFWVMTQNFRNKVAKEKYFLLPRQYQEEMLEAYLAEDDYSEEILHYCNVIMDSLGLITHGAYDYATYSGRYPVSFQWQMPIYAVIPVSYSMK